MKEQMGYVNKIMLVLIIIMLQACGGSSDDTVFFISADVNKVNFANEISQQSDDTFAIKVNFEGDGVVVGFAPEASATERVEVSIDGASEFIDITWLNYRAENVTSNSATVFIDVTNAHLLVAGTYTTTIRIATSNSDSSKFSFHDVDVSLVVWDLPVDSAKVKYSATVGDANVAPQTINITGENNPWTAASDVSWLSLDTTSGTGAGTIAITADISTFSAPGLQQGNIIITDVNSGDTKLIPVELALDNVYLFAERPAIALTATANFSTLSTTVVISNNAEQAVNWQASTTADWLSVTAINDHQLQISADPNSAPQNTISSANVVISATEGFDAIDETIQVNFYNSERVVENQVLANLAINNNEILTSPLKPYFYVAIGNQLVTYHQYTGEVEASVSVSPQGTVLEQLVIHPRGDYLLAKAVEMLTTTDETTGEVSTAEVSHRYRISLLDNSIAELSDADVLGEPTDIVRLSGRYFVVTQLLELADENLQRLFLDTSNAYAVTEIDVAKQADTLFALDNNSVSIKRYIPHVNDFGDDQITLSLSHDYHPQLLGGGETISDFIVTNDEANIYLVSKTSEWLSFNGEEFVDHGLLTTNENIVTFLLAKNNAGQANYLRVDLSNGNGFYLDMYDDNQTISATVLVQERLPSSMALSSDNQRLLIHADSSNEPSLEPEINLVTIAQ